MNISPASHYMRLVQDAAIRGRAIPVTTADALELILDYKEEAQKKGSPTALYGLTCRYVQAGRGLYAPGLNGGVVKTLRANPRTSALLDRYYADCKLRKNRVPLAN